MLRLFGKKKDDGGEQPAKLPRPKEILQEVGQKLVVEHKMDPDWVWNLKSVVKPYPDLPKKVDFRIFSPTDAGRAGVNVRDYNSLEVHPELVLFYGTLDKKEKDLELNVGQGPLKRAV